MASKQESVSDWMALANIQRQAGNMFFDEASDEIVQKFKAKISAYRAKAAGIEEQIKAKVCSLQNERITK